MTDAELVKSIRKLFCLTQTEFAHKIGYSFDTVRSWEQGRLDPASKVWRILLEQIVSRYSTNQCGQILVDETTDRIHLQNKRKLIVKNTKQDVPTEKGN